VLPRDRAGTFEPQIVPKHQRRLSGFDEAVISLYAKGMTTGDIAAHLEEVYDTTISRDLVSTVTEKVTKEMREWQAQLSRCPLTQKFRRPRSAGPRRCRW
jgi:putative transposase